MISVCIPTFNGELFIKEQVDSILTQLGPNDEIIISDDGSTDSTLNILANYKDSRIKIFENPLPSENYFSDRTEKVLKKVSSNVQNALMNCSGEYIYLADQDDIWKDGRISKTIDLLKKKEPILVVCNCSVIDENFNITEASYFNYVNPSANVFRTLIKSSFHGCCMCFNRALLSILFPFPKYSLGHDLWIGLTAMKLGNIYFIDEPLLLYRRHSATVTKTGYKSTNKLLFKIRYRFFMLKEYFKLRRKK